MPLLPAKSAGADYYALLKRLHLLLEPRTYVEIGIRQGQSLSLAKTTKHSVGIDPAPDVKAPLPPGAKVFRMTSDDFFARHNLHRELEGHPVDLAFIDGMHLFEFALRDFINLEKYCSPASTILVHDCYPIDAVSAARERTTAVWSGDVWKLLLCFKRYRPDLELTTIDVPPTGLGIIRNLDPGSTVLADSLDKICTEYIPFDYDQMAPKKAEALSRMDNDWKRIRALFPWAIESKLPIWLAGFTMRPRRKTRATRALSFPLMNGSRRVRSAKPRFLGVVLCYNDADILPDCLDSLLENNHDLVVWDHGSDDGTPRVLDKYAGHLIERRFIPRSFDFYRLHEEMSKHLMQKYCAQYDWVSWPDQDEILEGPARDRSYGDYLAELADSEFDWIEFRNFNYWHTSADAPNVLSPTRRIRYYCLYPHCAPRIRAWRASVTNLRHFNHNRLRGKKFPRDFNLRHYPMRTAEQMQRRLTKDRADLQRGGGNAHYNNMKRNSDRLLIAPQQLHLDDGKSELNPELIFDWRSIYLAPKDEAASGTARDV